MIRERTAELLREYQELTGAEYQPSLPEFLELRRQAIEECRLGLAEKPKAEERTPRETKEAKKSLTIPIKEAEQAPPPARKAEKTEKPQEKTAVRQKTEERSGFAILTELADPWN